MRLDTEPIGAEENDRRLGQPDVIRLFREINIGLSVQNNEPYNEWYVFPDPNSTHVVVVRSSCVTLDNMTAKGMGALKFALTSGLFGRESLIYALIRNEPTLDSLIQRALNNIPRL